MLRILRFAENSFTYASLGGTEHPGEFQRQRQPWHHTGRLNAVFLVNYTQQKETDALAQSPLFMLGGKTNILYSWSPTHHFARVE